MVGRQGPGGEGQGESEGESQGAVGISDLGFQISDLVGTNMRMLRIIGLLLWTTIAAVAMAADDDEVVVGPIVADSDPQQMQMQRFVEANFDQWMWQNTGDPRQGEQRIRTQARLQMSE